MATKTEQIPLLPARTAARTIAIAPGAESAAVPPSAVARVAVVELVPTGEPSTYRAVARIREAELRLTPEILRKLNIGVPHRTFRRLIKAGFVKGQLAAPNCYTFDLQSYYDHVAAVRSAQDAGNDFWSGENLRRYRDAI